MYYSVVARYVNMVGITKSKYFLGDSWGCN